MFFKWLLITWLSLPAILASSAEQWLKRSAYLDENRRFFMQWGNGDQEDIYIKLTVRTLGYVALGFSRRGTMINSDLVVGWVADDEVYLQDRHSEGNQMPELDRNQDYELISGFENTTHTTLFFWRKWDTCDHQDFALEYDNTIRVLHAYSFEDPVDEINIPYHGSSNRGWRSFMLLQPELPREKNVQLWDMTSNELTVSPEWDTLYWCKLFQVPQFGRKQHITMFEPLILGGNKGHVHHIITFDCAAPNPREYDQYLNTDGYNCLLDSVPSFVRECDGYYLGWAIGGMGTVFPEHFGFPLYPGRYMMLQIHYDNADRTTSTPGQAGIRYHHTPNLRQYDGGMLTVGVDIAFNVMAPPGVPDFVVAGHSNTDCVDPAMPPEGVMLFSTLLHTHLVGSGMKNRHFRNNVELPTLINNKHYDNNYQEFSIFSEERLLLPGDQLTVECTYDSTNRSRTTLGGFSTREEMCNSFIMYYPRMETVYGSRSLPPKRTTVKFLGSQELIRLSAGQEDYDQTFRDFMLEYDWNRTAIRRFEDAMRFSKHDSFCFRGTGDSSLPSMVSYPKGLQEYIEEPRCSNRRKNQRPRKAYATDRPSRNKMGHIPRYLQEAY